MSLKRGGGEMIKMHNIPVDMQNLHLHYIITNRKTNKPRIS